MFYLFIFQIYSEVVSERVHGHGFIPAYKDEYDIPFIIYSSKKNERLNKIYELNKDSVINMEGFNELFKFVTNINDSLTYISNSTKVIAVDKKNIINYSDIELFRED